MIFYFNFVCLFSSALTAIFFSVYTIIEKNKIINIMNIKFNDELVNVFIAELLVGLNASVDTAEKSVFKNIFNMYTYMTANILCAAFDKKYKLTFILVFDKNPIACA